MGGPRPGGRGPRICVECSAGLVGAGAAERDPFDVASVEAEDAASDAIRRDLAGADEVLESRGSQAGSLRGPVEGQVDLGGLSLGVPVRLHGVALSCGRWGRVA